MDEEINADVIKATQSSLGKFVKRPPLTEKLLKKPPFRFLHDVITAVLKNTGFFEGLFGEEELVSDNVKDRESKIIFLNKVITVLGLATGETLTVKPSKIIAGQEPTKTNKLLQCLGEALEKKLSSVEAVKKYKESIQSPPLQDKKSKDAIKTVKKAQDIKKASEKLKDSDKIITIKNEKKNSKAQQKENTSIKTETIPKKVPSTTSLKKNLSKSQETRKKINLKDKSRQENSQYSSNSNKFEGKTENSKIEDDAITENNEITADNIAETPVENASTAHITKEINKNNEDSSFMEDTNVKNTLPDNPISDNILLEKTINENVIHLENNTPDPEKAIIPETKPINFDNVAVKNNVALNEESSLSLESHVAKVVEKRPQSVRPSSSRPGAPRIKDKHDNALSHETPIVHKVNIIAENTVTEEDEDNSIIIVDNQTDSMQQNEDVMHLSSDQHGHLVQQILDSQKEFSQVSGKTEIEWQFGVQKARDVANQEIEQLRFNIQALSRISNPLGKVIDHIQEDVEVMRQELQEWSRKYDETTEELSKQKIANIEFLQPLQAKIKQLDTDIEEKRDKINDLRIVVFKNYHRIEKLLASGNVQ